MSRLLLLLSLALAACGAPTERLLVSPEAVAMGGNLYVETVSEGNQVLVLDGEITPATSFTFLSLLEQAEVSGLVIAQSPGGNLLASHQMGQAIAKYGLNTAVIVSCRSACVDVFIAGRQRDIAEGAMLGLHAASNPDFGYSIDKPYWEAFGLGAVNDAAYSVPHGGLWVIAPMRAIELRLATRILN